MPAPVLLTAIRRAVDRRRIALATGLKLPPGLVAEALAADRGVALDLRVEDRGTRAAPALDLVGCYP